MAASTKGVFRQTGHGNTRGSSSRSLIWTAVNEDLTELTESAFFRLLGRDRPRYRPQWFHGIEHLTIDQEGFVAWRGQEIERYPPAWANTSVARQSALELGRRCRQLEALGVRVDRGSAICNWDHHELPPCVP